MKLLFARHFVNQYNKLPRKLQFKVDKQLTLLVSNIRHPSLRAKKYDEDNDIWQARVDKSYRLYFRICKDVYEIISVISHPK